MRWAASALGFLLLACAPPEVAADDCSACSAEAAAASCPRCPAEIRAVLAGKPRVTRHADDLRNDCLTLEPVHPLLVEAGRERRSAPLDAGEEAHALRYGVRRVRVLPACRSREPRWPEQVLLARPLAAAERQRDDGRPKPTFRVDARAPGCIGRPAPVREPGPAFCSLGTAVAATRGLEGAILEIAGGRYAEPVRIDLGHGHVLIARDDEPVTLSGWLDLSGGLPGRPWVKASSDATGELFVLDWSDHRAAGGAAGNRLPVELDGRDVPMVPHYDAGSRAPDVAEASLLEHDARRDGPVVLFANPDHPSACMDSGVNVKSRELACERDGARLPCATCRARGVPVRPRVHRSGRCVVQPGTCAPRHTWQTGKRAGLERCRAVLGASVSRCVLLKLPPGGSPGDHALRSSHTDHGLQLFSNERRSRSGLVVRGLRLENLPISISGARQVRARSGLVARLDALDLERVDVKLLGSAMELANSRGRDGHVYVHGGKRDLEAVVIRNNVFDRYYGKSISWSEGFDPSARRSPARLHALAPLCETPGCGADRPVLFSGREDLAGWHGWSRLTFNWIRAGAAINAFGALSHTAIVANVFDQGGIQEGIVDLPFGARTVWVHHNTSSDSLGTGVKIVGAAEDVVISDNRFQHSPGDLAGGAGNERSAATCAMSHRPCAGAYRSILLKPGAAVCRDVTLENNLSTGSAKGAFAIQGCDGLTLRNNTAYGAAEREWEFLASPVPRRAARVLDNLGVDPAPRGETVSRYGKGRPFRVGAAAGNYFQGGAGPVATDRGWRAPPGFADAAAGALSVTSGWAGGDRCSDPSARFPTPGFQDRGARCGAAASAR